MTQFSEPSTTREALEKVAVSIPVDDAEPHHLHGSKSLWRPERISVTWTRRANALGEWDGWTMSARLIGSWLRKDGSRANKEPADTLLYRESYQPQEWRIPFLERAEKTRPTHEPPALAPLA